MKANLRMDAVLVQAVIAGALSFAHLHDIADAAGQHGWKAWAYPISVDLLLVAAWRRLRTTGPSRLAWCWFLVALTASLGANVATAGFLDLANTPAWLRFLVAGWPALAFMGGTLLAHAPRPGSDPSATVPAESTPAPAAQSASLEREETPAPAPTPAALPAAVPVPAALLDHAQKVATAHRTATGAPIDAETLRARLGVAPQLADAIASQLT
ncbi:DUF2637 domain-containing protein [Streptomyces sp. NPDC050738]|uniref:DUF2637 domain-containing protein n=1 Tax=Streptomyces sp. NPDC050738 TaxID=3154744 RepID=UPI0034247E8D